MTKFSILTPHNLQIFTRQKILVTCVSGVVSSHIELRILRVRASRTNVLQPAVCFLCMYVSASPYVTKHDLRYRTS